MKHILLQCINHQWLRIFVFCLRMIEIKVFAASYYGVFFLAAAMPHFRPPAHNYCIGPGRPPKFRPSHSVRGLVIQVLFPYAQQNSFAIRVRLSALLFLFGPGTWQAFQCTFGLSSPPT